MLDECYRMRENYTAYQWIPFSRGADADPRIWLLDTVQHQIRYSLYKAMSLFHCVETTLTISNYSNNLCERKREQFNSTTR
jgi:hypothetical protein